MLKKGTFMRLLLLDTCGETGSLALTENGTMLRERTLASPSPSAQLVGAIREELAVLAWPLRSLDGVGVVNGPGSFTGVRVGLAAAKGLCDVAGLRLTTLSRLEVLLHAGEAGSQDIAVLDAGRREFYVRSVGSREETVITLKELQERVPMGGRVLVSEEKLLAVLAPTPVSWLRLSAAHALALAEARLRDSGDSVEMSDASYVRPARGLYDPGAHGWNGAGGALSECVEIRSAHAGDLPKIVALERATAEAPHWNEAVYALYVTPRAEERKDLQSRALFVAVAGGCVRGFAASSCVAGTAEVESIAVACADRRSGLGRRLLHAVTTWAQDQDATSLLLEVRAGNEVAQAFYRSLGFRHSGSRPGYYSNPAEDALLLRWEAVAADSLEKLPDVREL